MALSNDLISQFVKATQDKKETKNESTAYGKIVKQGDVEYVQLDGSDLLTPISSTTVVNDGDRVIVTIKDHTAIVTGDLTDPSASGKEVKEIGNKISEFEIIIADKVTTQQLEAEIAKIDKIVTDNLEATNAKIETFEGKVADIDTIKADVVEVEKKITAHEGEFTTIKSDIADFENATAENFEATNADVHNLESDYASFKETTTNKLSANEASITELNTKKLDTESAKVTYANIDFSNIKEAAIEKLFTDSGIIKDLIMSDGKVTGELVGVTIKGDLIEGNTLKADKLVILGEDGLYYKLNVDALGETTASSDEKYQNGLDGSVIIAKSITADRVAVTDLVAFGATIGGYHITDHALYSGTKNSVSNTTRGVFLGDDGQMAVGDSNNYFKFFKDTDGTYKLEIRASAIKFGASGKTVEEAISDVQSSVDNLEIGGRNLLLGTKEFDKITSGVAPIVAERYKDFAVRSYDNSAATSGYQDIISITNIYPDKLGDVYTLSFYAKGSGTNKLNTYFHGATNYVRNVKSVQSNGKVRDFPAGFDGGTGWTLTDTWTRYWVTWTLADTGDISIRKTVLFRLSFGGTASICGVKLEKGNKATDWTPAPEEIETAVNTAQTTANNAQSDIDDLSIGGRNYILGGKGDSKIGFFKNFSVVENGYGECTLTSKKTYANIDITPGFILGCRDYEVDKQVVFSYDIMYTNWDFPEGSNRQEFWIGQRYTQATSTDSEGAWKGVTQHYLPAVGVDCELNEWYHMEVVKTIPPQAGATIGTNSRIQFYNSNADVQASVTFRIKNVKIEYGNRGTDWSPAPEEVDESISNIESIVETRLNEVNTSIETAQSTIDQLSNMISHLITDENGGSLMTQTTDGWTFNMSSISGNLNAIKDAMVDMENNQNGTNSALEKLTDLVNSVANKTAYITMATDDNGDPCIELGKSGNPFKVRITNTAIDFLEGSTRIAYANNNTFYVEKMIVKKEIQIGEGPGFVWRTRENGNMGLVWISG